LDTSDLKKALAQLDTSKVTVTKVIRPFFLDPTLPTTSIDKKERYAKKFGAGAVGPLLQRMTQTGLGDGIAFKFGGKIGNTLMAHRLLRWAESKYGRAVQEQLLIKLYGFYFEQEKDIADVATLVTAATEVGIDRSSVEAFLKSDEESTAVMETAQENMDKYDISGVPHFVIGDKVRVSGAQNPEYFVNAFRKLGFPLRE